MARARAAVDRVIPIVGFLVLTVGIVWIVMHVTTAREGFQIFETAECPMKEIGGVRTWLCDTISKAENMLANATSVLPSDRVCYRTDETNVSSLYVCYNRPAPITVDYDSGEFLSQTTEDDSAPQIGEVAYQTTCKTFPRAAQNLSTTYGAIVALHANVNEEVTVLTKISADMGALYTTFCRDPRTDALRRVCPVLDQASKGIQSNATHPDLSTLLGTLLAARTEMSNLLFTVYNDSITTIPCLTRLSNSG